MGYKELSYFKTDYIDQYAMMYCESILSICVYIVFIYIYIYKMLLSSLQHSSTAPAYTAISF